MAKFFVYVDLTDDLIPFYCGKGNQSRVDRLVRRNKKHTGISQKYGQFRLVVFESDSEVECFLKECEIIFDAELNCYRHPGNPFFGKKHSEETKRKISETKRKKRSVSSADNVGDP